MNPRQPKRNPPLTILILRQPKRFSPPHTIPSLHPSDPHQLIWLTNQLTA
jgi:hypothetical protein